MFGEILTFDKFCELVLPIDQSLRESVKKWKGELLPGRWGEEDADFNLSW